MPHFIEEVVAKTCPKSLLGFSGIQNLAQFFVSCSANQLLDVKIEAAKEQVATVKLTIHQLGALKISINTKGGSMTKRDKTAKAPSPPTDEGYESNFEDSKTYKNCVSSRSSTCKPSSFNLAHTLDTCSKTQHFAKTFNVFALNSNDIEAGQITARYINLPLIKSSLASKAKTKASSKSNFYTSLEDLNTGNSDGLAFAKALFCPRGTLLKKHKSDKTRNIGPWGSDLERSGVMVVKYLCVDKNFRRQGLARLLLNSLIEKAKERTGKTAKGKVQFVVVFPAVIKEDFAEEQEGKTESEKDEIENRHYDNAVGCYRALGFRRIGRSKWFGLALDPKHESRQVTVEDDLDPLKEP